MTLPIFAKGANGEVAVAERLTEGPLPRKKINGNIVRARTLRKQMSLPEVLLWNLLRGAPSGVVFRRQHPINENTIVDFYCAKAKVCIEIDGIVHTIGDQTDYDVRRDAQISNQGLEVIRIAASDILKAPIDVADSVIRYCKR
jgi:very-short-patch-repair endonuclease